MLSTGRSVLRASARFAKPSGQAAPLLAQRGMQPRLGYMMEQRRGIGGPLARVLAGVLISSFNIFAKAFTQALQRAQASA